MPGFGNYKIEMGSEKLQLKKIIVFFLLILTFWQPASVIYSQRDTIFGRSYGGQYEMYKDRYYTSQYVQKKNPGIITDENLESFAAGAFLKGLNPILIVHDQPPLGRYIIAASILLFDNQRTIVIALLSFSIFGLFLIGREVFQSNILALIPLAIFVNEPLFISKIKYIPLLEPIQLPFIIFALYFFIKGLKEKNYRVWFLLTSLMLGFVISIRFFALGAVLLFSMLIILYIKEKLGKKMLIFTLALPVSLIILLLSYSVTIKSGYSPLQILGIQKYILFYHQSKFTLPFSFFDLILFNRWHTWWGDRTILSDSQWIILWPISYLLTSLFFIFSLLKKIKMNVAEAVVFTWVILYIIFLSAGFTSTRYFLPLIPFLYILAISFIKKAYEKNV